MGISDIKKQSLSILKGNWGQVVLLTFIYFLINVVLVSVVEIIFTGSFELWLVQETTPLRANIATTVLSILLIPFVTGVYWYYLDLMREKEVNIGTTFIIYSDIKTSFKMVGASILQGLFLFLWSLLLIIPGIIKGLAYSQTFYILKDHPEYTIREAITESRKKMNGLKWKYFLLNLSFVGWILLGALSLGIAYLWIIPYLSSSLATFYHVRIADKKETE